MKKPLFIIACMFSLLAQASNTSENPEPKKRARKNLIEVGWSAGWLFNNQPLTFSSYGGMRWFPVEAVNSRLVPSYLKYAHAVSPKIMLSFSMHSFGVYYKKVEQDIRMSRVSEGKMFIMSFDDFTLSAEYNAWDKKLNRVLSVRNRYSAGISYRDGYVLVAGKGQFEGYAEYSKSYSSMGLGASTSLDLVISDRLYIGGLIGYTHYFESSYLDKDAPEYFDSYKPVRHVLRIHPKIGVLF